MLVVTLYMAAGFPSIFWIFPNGSRALPDRLKAVAFLTHSGGKAKCDEDAGCAYPGMLNAGSANAKREIPE